jgi:signal transduction histidine kinase
MEEKILSSDTFNIIITTIILLSFGSLPIFFLFRYQRKRYLHKQELFEMKEAFNKNLLQSKLEIQEQTLTHIARELHDNISPLISIVQLNLGAPKLKKNPDIQPELSELKSNAGQLMTELKSLGVTLNTDHIMHLGFVDALWQELDRIERTKVFKTTRTVRGEKFRLRPEHEIILFRMCQEILNNIVKHSDAKTITAEIDYEPGIFQITISDDGSGFDTDYIDRHAAENNSTGLLNIRSRAKLINADINVFSAPRQGTNTTIKVSHNQ